MDNTLYKGNTLRDYLRVIFRHKIIFVVLPLAVILPTFFYLEMQTPMYESSVKMYVKAQKELESQYYKQLFRGTVIEDHTELVRSNLVVERVVNALRLHETPIDYEKRFASRLKSFIITRKYKLFLSTFEKMPEDQRQKFLFQTAVSRLKSNISAVPVQALSFLSISVKDYDPNAAAIIANSVSRSYLIYDLEQQVADLRLQYGEKHSSVLQLENYIKDVEKTLDGKPLADIDAMGPASLKIVQQAEPGDLSGGLNKQFLLILSFVVSIFFSVIVSFVIDYFDQTFKSPHDVEAFLKIPFLGSIPKSKLRNLLIKGIDPKDTVYAKFYQNLSEQMSLLMRDRNVKTLLITDCEGSKDLPMISVNIGVCLTHSGGRKVLIVDADLRQASVSKALQIPNDVGIADVIEGKSAFTEIVHEIGDNLHFLPSGETPLNPITLLSSPAMSGLIKEAESHYDLIILVCQDLKNYTDALILSGITDAMVLVLTEGKVRRQVIENCLHSLRQKKVNIIGAILNNRKYVIPKVIYKLT